MLRGRCQDARTPLLASVVDAEPLSRREHEIALLVAAGETNKAISERLFLSVRTVESHVQRVLAKLGCRRRSEIADALGLGSDEWLRPGVSAGRVSQPDSGGMPGELGRAAGRRRRNTQAASSPPRNPNRCACQDTVGPPATMPNSR